MKRSSRLLVTVGFLVCLGTAAWHIVNRAEPYSSARYEQSLLATLQKDSRKAHDLVVETRLVVDEVHRTNERRIAHRSVLRENADTTHLTGRRVGTDTTPGPEQSLPVDCASVLRLDDRLVQNLQLEIGATRGLLSQYEALAAAQARELDTHRQIRADYVRKRRNRRLQNRALVAVVIAATVVVLAD